MDEIASKPFPTTGELVLLNVISSYKIYDIAAACAREGEVLEWIE
jgi:hypothetical protein